MSTYCVRIPGVVADFYTQAGDSEAALTEALLVHGLGFVPPGTTVTFVPKAVAK